MAKKKASKKSAKKKVVPKKAVKKATKKVAKKKAVKKKAAISKGFKPKKPIPCICIQNEQGWFCMKRLPNGELKKCDGPFGSKEDCEAHTCIQ